MSTCLWEPTPLPLTLYLPELGQMAVSNHISQAGKWILAKQSKESGFKEDLGGLFQSYQKVLKRGSVIFSSQSVPSSVIFSSANGICFHPISQTRSLNPASSGILNCISQQVLWFSPLLTNIFCLSTILPGIVLCTLLKYFSIMVKKIQFLLLRSSQSTVKNKTYYQSMIKRLVNTVKEKYSLFLFCLLESDLSKM